MSADYSNIREYLGHFIGERLMDITQHDQEEWDSGQEAYVCLMFESGKTMTFPITDLGFQVDDDSAT